MELDELLIKQLCLACDNMDLLKSDREARAFIWECAYACQGWVYRLQRQLMRKCDIHEHSYAVCGSNRYILLLAISNAPQSSQ